MQNKILLSWKVAFFIVCNLLLLNCKNTVSEKNLDKYILDSQNGLIKEQENNGIKISMVFRPEKLVSFKPESKLVNTSNLYFLLRISANGQNILNINDSKRRLDLQQKLSLEINDYIKVQNSKMQIQELEGFNYSQTSEMTPFTDILLVINKKKINYEKTEYVNFIMKELGLGIGNIELKFKKNDIEIIQNI